MNYISRTIQPALLRAFDIFPVITLCGPRQSGKTTLCRKEFPNLSYVNLEDIANRTFAMEDPVGFLMQFNDSVIIDEVQLVPELFSQIQVIVDENRFNGNNNQKFILTGSSNFSLLPNLRQSLAGRTGIYTLLPLSTHEIDQIKANVSVEELIIYGGYPAVWDSPLPSAKEILSQYIDTYVERDVRRLMEVKDLHKFSVFLRLCAARIGSELNKSSIAIEVGVSVPTIENWLSVLEASYVIYLLKPWHANIGKRLVKSSKLYFADTGIACRLLGISNEGHLMGHPLRGALFENLVINNTLKWIYNHGERNELYFYRDQSGREIDVIMERGGNLGALEIKAGKTFNTDFLKNIRYLKNILKEKLTYSGVIYAGSGELLKREEGVVNYKHFSDRFKFES